MNTCYFQRVKPQHTICSRSLNLVRKVLVVASVYLVFGLLFQYVYADINDSTEQGADSPYQSQHGSVWLKPDYGTTPDADSTTRQNIYIEALQMQTDVDINITGAIARATVRQMFINSSEYWAEGIYVFPLPERAAVDRFRMRIGERIIEGRVKERVEAKKIYQQAKAAGKKASLIEQQRPNVFTTSLANIAPGEQITVEFEYQQVLEYRDERYRLRFPMVVGPRYNPDLHQTGADKANTALQKYVSPLPDQTSVYTQTDETDNDNNPTRIHILLDAGVSLAELDSSYHQIDIKQTSENRYSISTMGESIKADRDFELVWKPELIDKPQLSVFEQEIDGDHYTMLTVLPSDLGHLQQKVQARDVIFVLDISGSMAGTSIDQAKASLITALDGLSSIDRFNIIWFNHESGSLFPGAVIASAQYKNIARHYIDNLQADGGTEMLGALKLALSKQETFSRFRQVVFLTDGNISNEVELFKVIDDQLGNNRLFTIGIGSAPNSYFMRKAANKGRGTFTYIGDVNEVHEKTVALFKKLENPALINIQLDLNTSQDDHNTYEMFPNIIPDLYAGETATILIKGKNLPDSIDIRGDYGNTEWHSSITAAQLLQGKTSAENMSRDGSRDGIRVAWAREKVASLMSLRHESTADNVRDAIKQEITSTALQHHLVSRFTSLVAVDVTPVNISELLYQQRMKNNLPHGWKRANAGNGNTMMAQMRLAQTATGSELKLLLGLLFFIAALSLYRVPCIRRAYADHTKTIHGLIS
ncbi:MAG: marine proteobacterial sortase target protein [Proteobacteria bacterium]|nr:marine proteobacterial sortase target protein [Pseudomonadota bacterium]